MAHQAIHSLIDDLQSVREDLEVLAAISYVVPSIDPDAVEFSRDSWDGSGAVASYPDPSGDADVATFRRNFLLAPPADSDEAGNKSAYKGPIRNSHDGAVNVNALQAFQAAANGARGGFEGVSEDTLRSAYNLATRLRVAAGDLEDEGDAPEFSASDAGSASLEASDPFHAQVEAQPDPDVDPDGLAGIIWASGTHHLWVNGQATRVHVPEETIPETFQRLQHRMEAGHPPKIGFDHPDDDSVAASTPLGEIGVGKQFSQVSDGGRETIVMQESEFTNNKAVEAAEAGAFEGIGFSIVGNIALETDSDGTPVKNDDDALQVQAVEVQRIDVVPDQAVEGATNGNMPQMAHAAAAAGHLAASFPNQAADGFVRTLRAAAGAGSEHDHTTMTNGDFPTDPDDLEAAQAALSQASDVVEQKDEKIEDLQAEVSDLQEDQDDLQDQADFFREIAASHGLDPDSDEFEAQAVIDSHTGDLRNEIADLEAALPSYDTEDVDDRADELEGSSISELEARAGRLWREFGQSKVKRSELSVAVAASESVGSVEGAGSGGNGSDADEAAQDVLRARELVEAKESGQSPAEYVESTYGIEASAYSSPQELQAKMSGGAD